MTKTARRLLYCLGAELICFALFGLFLSTLPRGPAQQNPRSVCLRNVVRINAAKEQWAMDTRAKTGAVPADTDLFGESLYMKKDLYGESNYMRTKPECPSGGKYSINAPGEMPTCSVPGHTVP